MIILTNIGRWKYHFGGDWSINRFFPAVEDESLFPNIRFQDKAINPHLLVEMIGDMLKE